MILLMMVSCSNDFLNENLKTTGMPAGESTIYISPEWDAADYEFMLPNMGSASFKIETIPSWLTMSSTTGTLVDGVATIRCSATTNSEFDRIGIYLDKIKVTAGSRTFFVPVAYINEGTPQIRVEKTLSIDYSSYDNSLYLEIRNTGDGILLWDVVSMPSWLSVDWGYFYPSETILLQNSSSRLLFVFNLEAALTKGLEGNIVLKTNDKNNPLVTISVKVDLGTPELRLWEIENNQIDFGAAQNSKTLRISNWGDGMLVWSLKELPEWLTASPTNGIYLAYTSYDNIEFTCDRTKLQPGLNSATIYLTSNDPVNPSYPITVTARTPGDNANVRALEGNVVDATFDKDAGILYYITSLPDKLVAYDVTTKTVLREIILSKMPTSFAITEDRAKAMVGHNGMVSMVNLQNYSVTRTLELDYSVYDVAWAKDDWFCLTKAGSSFSRPLWINAETSEIVTTNDQQLLDGASIVKKVPSQQYVIASRMQTSPNGLIVYDASTKLLKSYSHIDFGDFWFSEDGRYTFSRDGNVYRTSSATNSDDKFNNEINSIGQLGGSSNSYFYSFWIDHSSSSNSIWALSYNIYAEPTSNIYRFEDNNYTLVKTYAYSDLYQPDDHTVYYEVMAHYVFANKAGTVLSVLRKGIDNNNWSIEFIQVAQ